MAKRQETMMARRGDDAAVLMTARDSDFIFGVVAIAERWMKVVNQLHDAPVKTGVFAWRSGFQQGSKFLFCHVCSLLFLWFFCYRPNRGGNGGGLSGLQCLQFRQCNFEAPLRFLNFSAVMMDFILDLFRFLRPS